MIAFKGRLKFKQYIPSKRNRFGIKLFFICDCSTGFILNFIVYTGSATERVRTSGLDIPGSIVMLLLEKYLDKGHINGWPRLNGLLSILHISHLYSVIEKKLFYRKIPCQILYKT